LKRSKEEKERLHKIVVSGIRNAEKREKKKAYFKSRGFQFNRKRGKK
jgi:hypothetical protein